MSKYRRREGQFLSLPSYCTVPVDAQGYFRSWAGGTSNLTALQTACRPLSGTSGIFSKRELIVDTCSQLSREVSSCLWKPRGVFIIGSCRCQSVSNQSAVSDWYICGTVDSHKSQQAISVILYRLLQLEDQFSGIVSRQHYNLLIISIAVIINISLILFVLSLNLFIQFLNYFSPNYLLPLQ